LLVRPHRAHRSVVRWWDGREVALSGHAVAETYSVPSSRWRPSSTTLGWPRDLRAKATYEAVGAQVVVAE
jgi:hypothetical protein